MSQLDTRLLREGLVGVVTRAFALLAGLVTSWATIRFLGPETYGVYVTALAVLAGVGVIAGFGLRGAVIPELVAASRAGDPRRLAALTRTCLRTQLALWLLVCAALVPCLGLVQDLLGAPDVFARGLLILLPFALFGVWRGLVNGHLAAIGRVQVAFGYDHLLRPLGILALLGALHGLAALDVALPRLESFAAGLVVLELALLIAVVRAFRPTANAGPAPPPSDARARLYRTAIPIAILLATNVARGVADKAMLAGITNAFIDVGVLALALKFADIVPLTQGMLAESLSPMVSRLHQEGDRVGLVRAFRLATTIAFAAGAVVVLVVMLWAPFVLPFYGEVFESAYVPLLVLLGSRLVRVSSGSVTQALQMTQHTRILPVSAAVALALTIGLNALLIPDYGVLGVVIANAITGAVVQLLHAIALYLAVRVHAYGALLLVFLLLFAAVAAAAGALVHALGPLLGATLGTALTLAWAAAHTLWIVRRHEVLLRDLVPAKLTRLLRRWRPVP